MYSQEALAIYGDLLGAAETEVSSAFEKDAALRDFGQRVLGMFSRKPPMPTGMSHGASNLLHTLEAGGPRGMPKVAPVSLGESLAGKLEAGVPGANAAQNAAAQEAQAAQFKRRPGMTTQRGSPGAGPGISPGAVGAGVLGAGATGLGAYHIGKRVQKDRDITQRNLAFGAGAATGLVAPSILRNVADTAQTVALSPSNLFPRRY